MALRRGFADGASNFRGACERDLVHVRVLHQRLASRAIAGHDVHHAWRQRNFLTNSREGQCGQRSEFRGFQDHGISCGKGRRDFPCQHQQRKVPGNDLAHDPARGVAGKFLIEKLRPPRVMIEMPGDERDIEITGLADRLAVVEALEHGEQPGMFLHRARQGVEVARPGVAGEARPGGQGRTRGGDGGVHIRCAGLDDPGERGARRRVDDVEAAPVLPRHPPAAHVQPERAAVTGKPLQDRLIGLRRRPVLHRLEDLADARGMIHVGGRGGSGHRVAVRRRVASGGEVLELALDVGE